MSGSGPPLSSGYAMGPCAAIAIGLLSGNPWASGNATMQTAFRSNNVLAEPAAEVTFRRQGSRENATRE